MILRCLAILVLASAVLPGQELPATGSATLLPPDQRLSILLTEADHAKVLGKHAKAIAQYEEALEWVRKDPALIHRTEEVLQRLASAYIAAQRPADAVRVSRTVLGLHKQD